MDHWNSGLRVLVVDDHPSIRYILRDLFQFWGNTVQEAENGKEAIGEYRQFRPDLVLMDLEMPLMDGFEASKAIMELDPQATILLMNGFAGRTLVREAVEKGIVKAVMPKPFELDQLKAAVQEAVKNAGPEYMKKVRAKLSFVCFAISAQIEHDMSLSYEEVGGLFEILSETSEDLLKINGSEHGAGFAEEAKEHPTKTDT